MISLIFNLNINKMILLKIKIIISLLKRFFKKIVIYSF